MNTTKRLSSSFPELPYSFLEFSSRKICQYLTNWTRWNKRHKVRSSANSLFKWRFRSRHRCCCLSWLPSVSCSTSETFKWKWLEEHDWLPALYTFSFLSTFNLCFQHLLSALSLACGSLKLLLQLASLTRSKTLECFSGHYRVKSTWMVNEFALWHAAVRTRHA